MIERPNSSNSGMFDALCVGWCTATNVTLQDWKSNEDTTNIIPDLYNLNKELRQLNHLFANYKTVIDRLLSSDSEIFDETKVVKEKLSIKARNRFRRLQVQLQSLMLDAITDYLEEKKSLEDTVGCIPFVLSVDGPC